MSASSSSPRAQKPFYASFGFQVFAAMVVGLVLGYIAREMGPTEAGPNWLVQALSTVAPSSCSFCARLFPS